MQIHYYRLFLGGIQPQGFERTQTLPKLYPNLVYENAGLIGRDRPTRDGPVHLCAAPSARRDILSASCCVAR